MRVNISDDNENWCKWGQLVLDWITGSETRPTSTSELNALLKTKGINGVVPGPDRPLLIRDYSDDIVYIYLPSEKMLGDKLATTHSDPASTIQEPYPLPLFYNAAYEAPVRAIMSPEERRKFALRRIGEYTVNECC